MSTDLTLDQWQREILPRLSARSFHAAPINNVTLLAYFFWDDDRIETKFYSIECSFLCAFENFGITPAVLVVNRETRRIRDFCSKYRIDLQLDPALTGGTKSMNIDCNSKLYQRFKTDYVLTIESDGIMVNPGLEKFVGAYDYIGAPWTRHITYIDFYPYPKFAVGNSGFCLRSKRMCAAAAHFWGKYFKRLPFIPMFFNEDVYFTRTLSVLKPSWRKQYKIAPIDVAAKFAIEHNIDLSFSKPIGFHSNTGFQHYCSLFGIPMSDLLTH